MFRILFQSGYNYSRACEMVENQVPQSAERDLVLDFIRSLQTGHPEAVQPEKSDDEIE